MNFSKKTLIILFVCVISAIFGFAVNASAATYYSSGTLYSTNLLSGQTVSSIDYFGYNATIPTGTSLSVQFSQDNTNWYKNDHTSGTVTLLNGNYLATNVALALSGGWNPALPFYYQIAFATTDTSQTPTLINIQLWYGTGATYATVSTGAATSVTSTSATGNATVSSIGNSTITTEGFQYGLNETSYSEVSQTGSYGTGDYSLTLPNLSAGAVYYVRAFVTNTEGRAYGSWQTFTTTSYYYYTSGTLYSTNLLSGLSVTSIDSFYTSDTVPLETSLSVLFSQDNINWYGADNTANPTTLPNGTTTTSLSALGWTTANFYYKMTLSSNTARDATPVINSVALNYNGPITYYWYGGAGNWSDYTNHWSLNSGNSPSSPASNAPTSVDSVVFDSNSGTGTVTIDSASVSAVNLNDSSVNITIDTTSNGITVSGDLTAAGTISGTNAVTLSGASNNIYGSGTISAPIALSAATYTVNVAPAATLTINGVISSTGVYGLTKIGAGTLTLSGTNTFTGQLTVAQGILATATVNNISANGPLGNSALAVILGSASNTGTLDYTGGGTVSSTKTFTLATGGIGVIQVDTGATNLTISGVIAGSGAINKTGAGTLILSAINTFTGGLNIKAGTVQGTTNATAFGATTNIVTIGDTSGSTSATLLYATTGKTITNPIVLGTGTTGTLTIGNTGTAISTTFSGGITGVNNLIINENATSGTITFSTASVNNTGTITNIGAGTGTTTISGGVGANVTAITENSTTSALTISTTALTVNSSGTTLTNSNSSGSSLFTVSGGVADTGNLILNNNSTIAGGITISTTSVNHLGAITNSGTSSGSTIISAVIGTNVTGLTQNSSISSLTLSGNNSIVSGNVTITSGTLALLTTTALSVLGNWSNSGTFTANSSTVTLTGTGSGGTITSGGSGFYALTINGSGGTYTLQDALTISNNLTITAGILQLSTLNLTVTGATSITGTLNDNSVTGTNLFVGAVTVNSGGIWTETNNPGYTFRGGLTVATGGSFTSGAGTYTFNTNNQSIGDGVTFSIGTATITTITLTNNNTAGLTIATAVTGNITQGTNAVLMLGGTYASGTLTASATGNTVHYTSTSTGQTVLGITYNNLTINDSGQIATLGGTITVNSNLIIIAGTLDVSGSNFALNVGGNWSNSGTFTAQSGTVTLTGTDAGGTLASASQPFYNLIQNGTNGTYTLQDALSVSNNLTITAGTLDVSTSNYGVTVGATWSRAGTFTPRSGTLTLTGTSTFSDTTSFYNLTINGSGQTTTLGAALTLTGTLTATAGTLAGSTQTITTANFLLNGGTFTGSGAMAINGNLIYTAGTNSHTGAWTQGTGNLSWNTGSSSYIADYSVAASSTMTLAATSYVKKIVVPSSATVNVADQELRVVPSANEFMQLEGTWQSTTGWVAPRPTASYSNSLIVNVGAIPITFSAQGANATWTQTGAMTCGALTIRNGSTGGYSILTVSSLTAGAVVLGSPGLDRAGQLNLGSGTHTIASVATADVVNTNNALGFDTSTVNVTGSMDLTGITVTNTSATINIAGNWTNVSTWTPGTGAVTFNGSSAQTISGANTWYDLTINNSATTPSDTVDVDPDSLQTVTNTLTITDGQWTPFTGDIYKDVAIGTNGIIKPDSGANINVSGNWSNSGTFTANSDTVTLNGTNQTITGATTFYNLTKNVTSAATLTFPASVKQTITNTLNLSGATGQLLSLVSSTPTTQWQIDPQSTRTISYLSVTDSNNTNATAIDMAGTNSTDGGNNTNWLFDITAPTTTPSATSNGSSYTFGNYTGTVPVIVTLSCADNEGGVGCASGYPKYCTDTANTCDPTTTYTTPVPVSTENTSYIRYYSADTIPNTETTKSSTIKIDTTAPTGATISSVVADSTSQLTITVNTSSDAGAGLHSTPYQFEETSGNSGATSSGWQALTTFTDTGLSPNTDYTYKVRAKDILGNTSDYSSTSSKYTLANTPGTPTLTVDSASQITATWSANSNPSGTEYYIENTTNSTNSGWITTTSWISSGLTCNTSYSFKVKARNTDPGTETDYSTTVSATTSACPSTGGGGLPFAVFLPPTPPLNGFQVLINGGSATTNSQGVNLTIRGSSNTIRMSISNDPNFINAIQEPYTISKSWRLSDGQGQKTVYVKFFTTWGVSSKVITASINYQIPSPFTPIINIITPPAPPPPPTVTPIPPQPPIEEVVKKEAPESMKNIWDILPTQPIKRFVLSPVPKEIMALAQKFPQLEKIFEEIGMSKITDVEKLIGSNIILPNLPQVIGVSSVGVPIENLTDLAKEKIPTEILFVKTESGLIDYNTTLSLNEQGHPEQQMNTLTNQPIQLIIKPDKPAKAIKGYLIFKQNKARPTTKNNLATKLTVSLFQKELDVGQNQEPADLKQALVLTEFDFSDNDNDGIWTANITSPAVDGEYKIITVIDYENQRLQPKELHLVTIVDPEGYVYTTINRGELRINNAKVTLYWLSPETKSYQTWPAQNYQQINPRITDGTGKYSFLAPEGTYYLEVEARGYQKYQSDDFELKKENGIHFDIELKPQTWWLQFIDWKIIALVVLMLSLAFNFYRDRKIKIEIAKFKK